MLNAGRYLSDPILPNYLQGIHSPRRMGKHPLPMDSLLASPVDTAGIMLSLVGTAGIMLVAGTVGTTARAGIVVLPLFGEYIVAETAIDTAQETHL